MEIRSSSFQSSEDIRHHSRNREVKIGELRDKISSGQKFTDLGQNPTASANGSRYLTRLSRLEKYHEQVSQLGSRFLLAEGHMDRAIEDLQQIRVSAVQGANGTNTKEDLQQLGRVVNELLLDLVDIANARDEDGTALFSGTALQPEAYSVTLEDVPGLSEPVIAEVFYRGNNESRSIEFSDGKYIQENFPGSQLFWAESQRIIGAVPTDAFVVREASRIEIDGISIPLEVGDNARTIAEKINGSPLAVRAEVDPVSRSFVLRTTQPHQIWLSEPNGSRNLQELGLTRDNQPPYNLADRAQRTGISLFESVIGLRNALLEGDTEAAGGRYLAAIDASLSNMTSVRTTLGVRTERIQDIGQGLEEEGLNYLAMDAEERSLDVSEALIELSELERVQTASYMVASKIMDVSLMDFLR